MADGEGGISVDRGTTSSKAEAGVVGKERHERRGGMSEQRGKKMRRIYSEDRRNHTTTQTESDESRPESGNGTASHAGPTLRATRETGEVNWRTNPGVHSRRAGSAVRWTQVPRALPPSEMERSIEEAVYVLISY